MYLPKYICLNTYTCSLCLPQSIRLNRCCGTSVPQYKLSTRIARISNSYGPRLPEDGGGVVGTFIKQALRNKPIYVSLDPTSCLLS